jgi:hypothetical protein
MQACRQVQGFLLMPLEAQSQCQHANRRLVRQCASLSQTVCPNNQTKQVLLLSPYLWSVEVVCEQQPLVKQSLGHRGGGVYPGEAAVKEAPDTIAHRHTQRPAWHQVVLCLVMSGIRCSDAAFPLLVLRLLLHFVALTPYMQCFRVCQVLWEPLTCAQLAAAAAWGCLFMLHADSLGGSPAAARAR